MDSQPARWEPARAAEPPPPLPPLTTLLARGARNRCPVCGEGHVFQGFLRVVPECSHCHTPLGRLRADDAPPYFTIFIVGHLLVPVIFWVEKAYEPPMWLHMAVWLPLFALISTLMLRPIKGATVGLMLRLGLMEDEAPPASPANPSVAPQAHRPPPPPPPGAGLAPGRRDG